MCIVGRTLPRAELAWRALPSLRVGSTTTRCSAQGPAKESLEHRQPPIGGGGPAAGMAVGDVAQQNRPSLLRSITRPVLSASQWA